jgi:glycyl-tRNA synthetase beta chain
MKDLLLEIGCENLPPHAIRSAFEQLQSDTARKLEELRLPFENIYTTGAPRRLVLIVRALSAAQTAKTDLVTGPPVSKAYDEKGEPTLTALGFARSHGVDVADLERVETARGVYVGFSKKLPCARTTALLKETLPGLVLGLKFPKMMRWEKTGTRFARPIRWIVCLYGGAVVPFSIAGVKSGDTTFVEPWLKPGRFRVRGADHYLAALDKAGLVVDHEARYRAIEALARKEAGKRGVEVIEDPALMTELTFMLESPRVFVGEFDRRYLKLPAEVVATAMKAHQRYIALRSKGKKLAPMFLSFTEGRTSSAQVVLRGNERVLRARLEDALFYWQEDLKTGIDGLARRLGSVVFIEGMGTLDDKAKRLQALCRLLNDTLAPEERVADHLIDRAAVLAKADLASGMVRDGKEFTLLEGLIGSHYARDGEEPPEVVAAIREHYLPRLPSDPLPRTPLGTLLGIADRVDTVCGCFLAGLIPTGSQDPYALRRQAMALVRLLERHPGVGIAPLVGASVDAYAGAGLGGKRGPSEVVPLIEDFFRARTETFLRDKGIAHDVVSAVGAVAWSRPGLAMATARAIAHLRGNRAFELLITGVKRVGNILAKDVKVYGADWSGIERIWAGGAAPSVQAGAGGQAGRAGMAAPAGLVHFDADRLEDEAERALYDEVRKLLPRLQQSEARSDLASVFARLSELGPAIDRYFDRVLVNCPDPALRANRHRFLAAVFALFSKSADFSLIVEEGKTSAS